MKTLFRSSPLAAVALLACTQGTPGNGHVLYLRQAQPEGGTAYDWVSPNARDLGSFSLQPPNAFEERTCGSVVAFAASPGLLPEELQVDEVLFRLWWQTGMHRGYLALNAPGLVRPLAATALEATGRDPQDPFQVGDYSLASLRVPANQLLKGQQPDQLYVTLDAAGGTLQVPSCPSFRSMVVLNPPSEAELAGRDADGDGHDDLQELQGAQRDPFGSDPPQQACLPTRRRSLPELPRLEAPSATGELGTDRIEGQRRIEGQVLSHSGPLEVHGQLELAQAGLLLAPSGGRYEEGARILVRPGGSLAITQGSIIAAADPAWGFMIEISAGAQLELTDSVLLFPGSLYLESGGRTRSDTAGLVLRDARVTVRGNRFRHGLEAIRVQADGVRIEGNLFERNGTAIWASGRDGHVLGNTSVGDGTFLELEANAQGWQVSGNRAVATIDRVFCLRQTATGNTLRDNLILRAHQLFELNRSKGNLLADNLFCSAAGVIPQLEGGGNDLQDNLVLRSNDPRCLEREQP